MAVFISGPTCSFTTLPTSVKRCNLHLLPLNLDGSLWLLGLHECGCHFQGQATKGDPSSSYMKCMAISWDAGPWHPAAILGGSPSHMERLPVGIPADSTTEVPANSHHQLPNMWVRHQMIPAPSLWATPADAKWSRDKLSPLSPAQISDLCANIQRPSAEMKVTSYFISEIEPTCK